MSVHPRNLSQGFYFKRKIDNMICYVVSIQDEYTICLMGDGSVERLICDELTMVSLEEIKGRITGAVFVGGSYFVMLSETLVVEIYDDHRFKAIENNEVIFECVIKIDYVNELQQLIRLKFMPQLKLDFVTYAEQSPMYELPFVVN